VHNTQSHRSFSDKRVLPHSSNPGSQRRLT
jgi:hypothetical protein